MLLVGSVWGWGQAGRSKEWALPLERGRGQAKMVANDMKGSGWGIV